MFIKKTTKRVKGKTYVNHLLVESVATPKGPRHRTVCSLGSLVPAPKEQWLSVATRVHSALSGQAELFAEEGVGAIVEEAKRGKKSKPQEHRAIEDGSDLITVHSDRVGGMSLMLLKRR